MLAVHPDSLRPGRVIGVDGPSLPATITLVSADAPPGSVEASHLQGLCTGESGDANLEYAYWQQCHRAFKVFCERQRKYGPSNIAMSGLIGLAVRQGDKAARLIQMCVNNKGGEASDESILDTIIDQTNYGIIGLIWLAHQWPTQRSK